MKETAKEIYAALRRKGFQATVRCRQNYTIAVTVAKDLEPAALELVKAVYNAKSHTWLMVRVNNHWLPLSAKVGEREAVTASASPCGVQPVASGRGAVRDEPVVGKGCEQ